MYHYVRNLPHTPYPRIKGLLVDEFRSQIQWLSSEFEMATLDSALEFLGGRYTPRRQMCMLTFDDGLKEHFTEVMPILAERRIQGIFGIITSCVHEHRVASVHMNHFLTAALDFDEYQASFLAELQSVSPGLIDKMAINPAVAQYSYPLDTREMAMFKLLINFLLPADVRDRVIRTLFNRYCGDEATFAGELYMNWAEIRQLQAAGMLLAGHTHWHRPLSSLTEEELAYDVTTCRTLLNENSSRQELWPFSYPYGKRNSYSAAAIDRLRHAGYDCGLATEAGENVSGTQLFELFRVDCKAVVETLQSRFATI
jgi:peptidoglycan/xylan/chitin deacetylase (PgdA/CDA1 family)